MLTVKSNCSIKRTYLVASVDLTGNSLSGNYKRIGSSLLPTFSMEYPIDREYLGQQVRRAWVRWAQSQPAPKPNWLIPWEQLDEKDKEADRQIGEAIAKTVRAGRFRCSACEGTGVMPSQPHLCPECEGNGVKFIPPHYKLIRQVDSGYKTFEQLKNGDAFQFPQSETVWLKLDYFTYQRIGGPECYSGNDCLQKQVILLEVC